MQRVPLVILALLMLLSPASAQELAKIPLQVQKHMESMVGSWTFKGTQGDRKFSGAETIRLTNNKTALLQEGFFDLTDGTKEHYIILSGWDGSKKTVLVRGFTTDGVTWAGEWKNLKDGKWQGTASGGPAKFEVSKDTMRYEDSGT
jgi:hypothetical protein